MTLIKTERIVWIDWAKTICMFLVILGHCHINESYGFVTQYIYSFHMMFFFFLSGILCKRELSILSLNRDIRFIILPYFTYGIVLVMFGFLRSRSFDLIDLFLQTKALIVGDNISIGPIWFLPALFICKQLFLLIKKVKIYSLYLYWLFFIMSLLPASFISKNNLNIPLFADSALFGLPFFFVGNESHIILEKIRSQNWYKCVIISVSLFVCSLCLCKYNGFVSLAACSIGQSFWAYYIGAYSAIIALTIMCMLLNNIQSSIITVVSYGSIVTLGLHSIPLTFFNYYLPIILGYEPSTYSFILAFLYSMITYCICYFFILLLDRFCPAFFGLKGYLIISLRRY